MTAGGPWSVKGIDPKAREIAKDLARRSGMTLGEWLNQVILEDEGPVEEAPRYPTFGRHAAPLQRRYEGMSRPVEDALRMGDTLDRLSARIEAADQRSASAINGIEHAVGELMARLDSDERELTAHGARVEGVLDDLRSEQLRAAERLRRIEQDSEEAPRAAEAVKAIEAALAKVAGQLYDGQTQTTETFDGLRQELDGVYERLDGAFTEDAAKDLIESVIARLSGRLEQAERRTSDAVRGLETAFGRLDSRLKATEARLEDRSHETRLEALAEKLGEQIDAVRAEMAQAIKASAADHRFEKLEQALEAINGHVSTAEQRSAGAIEKMGHELLRMADALGRTVQDSERRSSQAIDAVGGDVARINGEVARVGGEVTKVADTVARGLADVERRSNDAIERVSGEVSRVADTVARGLADVERRSTEAIERVGGEVTRVADAVEQRLSQADAVGAQALERLSAEIARITERMTERIANAERRQAQAIDDVGEQVARATERLQDRHEKVSTDLTERIRQSEERTARFLDEARERIDKRLEEAKARPADAEAAFGGASYAPMAYDAYADPAVAPFGDDTFVSPTHGPAEEAHAPPSPVAEDEVDPVGADLHADLHEDLILFEPPAALEGEDDYSALHEPEQAETSVGPVDAPAEAPAEPHPAAAAVFDDPFADDDSALIEPARSVGEAEDYGAGLFAESESPSAEVGAEDDEWFTPGAAQSAHDDMAHGFGPHELLSPDSDAKDSVPEFDAAPAVALAEHHEDPKVEDTFEPLDEFVSVEPSRPRTTRELIEQARAAARAASPGNDAKTRREAKSPLFTGFGLGGGKKKKNGSTMRTALLATGGAAALGMAAAGYVILSDKPHGALPERVAAALGMRSAHPGRPLGVEASNNPLAAVALSPKPIAGQVAMDQAAQAASGADGAELYNDAVRRIEARDRTGLAALQKAANLGYAPAQFYLAKLYEDGQAGLTKDMVEARRWTQRAAEGGDRKAMHNLALYSFEGVGGPKNLTDAAQWFRRAADLGLTDSQYNLARLYEEGFGVAQNPAEAYKWYLIASRTGDTESRMSALRIKGQLSAEAQSAAERAAQGFQAQGAQPLAAPTQTAAVSGDTASVATAQKALAKLGFYQGPTDGSASPALKLAIAAYQRGQGLPATGQLDPSLTQRLAAIVQQ